MSRIAFLPRLAAAAVFALPVSLAHGADAYCSLPGELVSEDAAGDPELNGAPDPVPGHDVVSVHVAEPAEDKIVFTLTVDATPAAVPNVQYFVNFTGDDGIERYASYNPYPLPGEPSFEYGHTEPPIGGTGPGQLTTDGTAGAESSADPTTGTISIWLPRSRVLGETVEVSGIYGEAEVLVGVFGTGLVTPVDDSPQGFYTIRGGETCAKSASVKTSSGFVAGGGIGFGLLAPLALLGLRRRAVLAAVLAAVSGGALAADPANGTITPEAPELTYTFPIAPIANVSGLTGLAPGGGEEYECTEPQYPCDNFELTLNLPADYMEKYPDAIVRVAAATDNDQFDIDLQIKDAAGKYVAVVRDNPPEQPTARLTPKGGTETFTVQVTHGTPHTGGSVVVRLEPGDAVKSSSSGLLAAGATGFGALLALGAAGLGRRFRQGR